MEDMINLSDLLKHEILDMYSAEEQIIDALPAMIDKATNPQLKQALREHLAVTKEQKNRLDQIKEWMGEGSENDSKNKGFFSRMFSGSGGSEGEKCKAMEGLIEEGEKMMSADASEEVCDAAIIASAQKIEHYEISSYGTARTYARELQLNDVARLLEQTLSEEYEADDLLTKLATSRINLEAEAATDLDSRSSTRTSGSSKSSRSRSGSSTGGRTSARQTSEIKSASEKSKSSSTSKGNSPAKNSSSKTSSSKSSKSGGSSKSGSNGSTGKGQKSTKRSTANKKATRSKSRASR